MNQSTPTRQGLFARGLVIAILLVLPILAFGFIGAVNPFAGPSTQLVTTDDPIRNGLHILDTRKDTIRGEQPAATATVNEQETVLLLKTWDFTGFNGSSRR